MLLYLRVLSFLLYAGGVLKLLQVQVLKQYFVSQPDWTAEYAISQPEMGCDQCVLAFFWNIGAFGEHRFTLDHEPIMGRAALLLTSQ